MSFGGGKESFAVKKFETQQEVEEKRRARQAHWETVRKADDPAGNATHTHPRCLFFVLAHTHTSQVYVF